MKIALITGATSGIGKASARKFAENDYNIIITGRRREKLQELEKEILSSFNVKVLSLNFDIRNLEEVNSAIDSLPEEWKKIDVLLNNAGLAVGVSPIHEGTIDDWERMIDTNIKGLLYISRKICPLMISRKEGHIINIASIAGKEVYPGGNVYCASKHAVDALSKAMRIDMVKHNIKVTNIAPGMVETEFSIVRYKGDKNSADKVYEGFKPLSGEDIADIVIFAATRPNHVCLNDIVIMPTSQASSRDVYRTTE